MAKCDVLRSCGHQERIMLFGPGSSKRGDLSWFENQPCFECRKAKTLADRGAKAIEAKAYAEQNGWVKLTGSEKQVDWAETIRYEFCCYEQFHDSHFRPKVNEDHGRGRHSIYAPSTINGLMTGLYEIKTQVAVAAFGEIKTFVQENPEGARAYMNSCADAEDEIIPAAIIGESSAKFWIDNRDRLIFLAGMRSESQLRSVYEAIAAKRDWRAESTEKADDEKLARELDREILVVLDPPVNAVGITPVTIAIEDGKVTVCYPVKNSRLYDLVKERGVWASSKWIIGKTPFQTAEDVAAEFGAKFLDLGFRVSAPNQDIADAIASGSYKPFPPRRCVWNKSSFEFGWTGKDDNLYKAVKKIAKWNGAAMIAPKSKWEAVESICLRWEFAVSEGALKEIQAERDKYSGSQLVVPTVVETTTTEPEGIPDLDPSTATADLSLEDVHA